MRFRFMQLSLGMAFLMVSCCPVEAQSAARIEITGDITLVESPQNPPAATRATGDLAADFAKVFGRTPKRVQSFAESGPVMLWIGTTADVPADVACVKTTATESFAFSE